MLVAVKTARIAVLGRLTIEREGQSPGPRGLPGRRAELVFAYLAAEHRRTVSRDELADALWPELLPDSWAAALRGVVSDVRRFLEEAGLDPAEVLAAGRGGYQLRLPAGVVVDIDEAREAVAAARQELSADAAAAAADAGRAAALARLPFLPTHEGDWVDGVRAELESMQVEALELEARAWAEAGDLPAAAAAAERLVKLEPFKEPMHQLRIRMLGEAGDRAGALEAYERCRAVLSSELGVEPSAETEAVFRAALERAATREISRPAPAVAGTEQVRAHWVLVVEDHDFQRRTALQLLRGLGITELTEASDGAEALELLARSAPPDVILVDLDMPGMDGVEFIRHVAERELASAVMIVSGLDPTVVHAVEALTEAYGLELLGAIEKPLTARRLAEVLGSYRPQQAAQPGEGPEGITATDVAGALDEGKIVARWRPSVDLSNGSVSGAAALWRRRGSSAGSPTTRSTWPAPTCGRSSVPGSTSLPR
jgi:SARP family transcriptional regulator, regulator of embCAB operon